MKIVLFYHSLLSDWNHGNAHFLRGVSAELIDRGHQVQVLEPKGGWSLTNLLSERGEKVYTEFRDNYPTLTSDMYDATNPDLGHYLQDADLVLVHEWNDHDLVKLVGNLKKKYDYKLLFHDTHHRSVTEEQSMSNYDLSNYDGVLAYGEVIKNIYQKKGWVKQAWTWHEAADTRLFHPIEGVEKEGDLVWIGNWGDDERTEELIEFLIEPVKELGLKAKMYGVRYPDEALKLLADAGIEYGGYLPSFQVPHVFAKYRFTIHVPRRPYTRALPGIPTIRPFEAMSCGIPLISAPWQDAEQLFNVGKDYLSVANGNEMKERMQQVLNDPTLAASLAENGLQTIRDRHSCAHRADELMEVYEQLTQPEPTAIKL
ncbi:glycosyltransferase [Telluribacter sp. SYSU D00476]|uniref:CgeB family protein n=1 Tax=Telluribacter sp. SYSU D00476 TaxID=2811430 RepID=UPI001FF17164|nr:glycosyltransferase [Telluribacter sp. SYSU D00476]